NYRALRIKSKSKSKSETAHSLELAFEQIPNFNATQTPTDAAHRGTRPLQSIAGNWLRTLITFHIFISHRSLQFNDSKPPQLN
ncbi:hypothetical protein, partial [Pseudomonas sp. KCJK9111]|uniref:hypothetical protein n=1 Tax=Pseudomonas sp. KCJK9111 TaxID=3344555 RepID=UPI00390676AD